MREKLEVPVQVSSVVGNTEWFNVHFRLADDVPADLWDQPGLNLSAFANTGATVQRVPNTDENRRKYAPGSKHLLTLVVNPL